MKLKLLIIAGCCLMSLYLSGQSAPLKGTTKDSETGKGIPFANLLLLTEKTGTAADSDGQFELPVKKWPAQIRVSAIGYLTDTVIVEQLDAVQITLQPVPADLPLVEVLAQKKLRQLSPEDRLLLTPFLTLNVYIPNRFGSQLVKPHPKFQPQLHISELKGVRPGK